VNALKVTFELTRTSESLQELEQENHRLTAENQRLMDRQDEIDYGPQSTHIADSLPSPIIATPLSAHVMTPELEAKVTNLEKENQLLRARQRSPISDAEQHVQLLQTQLDDVTQSKNRLESELRTAHQKVLELETQIASGSPQTEASSAERKQKQRVVKEDLAKKTTELHEAEKRLKSAADMIKQLQDQLTTKDEERQRIEKKYKRYLDKAKKVIEQLGGSGDAKAGQSPEVDLMQRKLAEKDKMYEILEVRK
jgi:chromosome segregation ATPase